MTTRMVHPQHGATHAYDKGEIERLEKLGWSVEGAAQAIQWPTNEEVAERLAAIAPARKKPGPKPKAK